MNHSTQQNQNPAQASSKAMFCGEMNRRAANDAVFGSSKVKLKIGDFRRLVDSLDFSRGWLTGGTTDEFKRQDIPGGLQPKISQIEAALPLIGARYAQDIESAKSAIDRAKVVIERWLKCQ